MMKVVITYPTRTEERAILDAMSTTEPTAAVRSVVSADQILQARHVVNAIHINEKIRNYIVDSVLATRPRSPHHSQPQWLYPKRRVAAPPSTSASQPERRPFSMAGIS